MKIGELAKVTKCTTETIRYYEKSGLLPTPERNESNYRLYNQTHEYRLNFIRNCRSLAMSHEEIRRLLTLMDKPPADCSDVNHLLDEHINHVDTRLQELIELKEQLNHLQQQCQNEDVIDHCGILQGLKTMEHSEKQQSHLK